MTPRVHAEWARRVAAEYRSAAVTAQALTWAIQVGLPAELLHAAHRVVGDELDHAALAMAALVALGGADAPVEVDASVLELPAFDGALPSLAASIARDFCLGETLAVPYFAAMRTRATHPAVVPVLDRILADEARHRALGWDALDALLAAHPPLRPWIAAGLPTLEAGFGGYREPPDAPPLTADERACGLLEHAEYAALYRRTWAEDIGPRFARRGIGA